MVDFAVATCGVLHVAVNSAGISLPEVRTHQATLDQWNTVVNLNLTGTWLCLRTEVALFLAHGGGAIVNVAAGAGLKSGPPGLTSYTASKHGVVGLTRSAAMGCGQQSGARVGPDQRYWRVVAE